MWRRLHDCAAGWFDIEQLVEILTRIDLQQHDSPTATGENSRECGRDHRLADTAFAGDDDQLK
jgi:hypothetical protein